MNRRQSLNVYGTSAWTQGPGLQVVRNTIDPSEGALYTGGSNWSPGMPLAVSSSGLADAAFCSDRSLDGSCTLVPLEYLAAFQGHAGTVQRMTPARRKKRQALGEAPAPLDTQAFFLGALSVGVLWLLSRR